MELEKRIEVTNTPALLEVNFEQLKSALEVELQKYVVVVTAETVKDAKKLATELNATKNLIDKRRKEEVGKASEPIKAFDENMKELVLMCAKGRQDILDQVGRFERETEEKAEQMLSDLRESLWVDLGVKDEFKSCEFDDLVKVSSVTDGGKLTKGAQKSVEDRVRADLDKQHQVERRLLELENRCYKAGLTTPLQRGHVQAFLFASDEVYTSELDKLIGIEISRQEEAEAKLREKAEAEKQQAVDSAVQATIAEVNTRQPSFEGCQPQAKQPEKRREPVQTPSGTVPYEVTCIFSIAAPESVSIQSIENELRKVMAKAGLAETLSSIRVDRLPMKQAANS